MITAISASAILVFFLGACVGSAYLCFLYRKQTGESWKTGRSHCDSCGHVLGIRDLIPIVSYLCSHGRCKYCNAKIPKLALKTELDFGVKFLLAALLLALSVSQNVLLSAVAIVLIASAFAKAKKQMQKKEIEG